MTPERLRYACEMAGLNFDIWKRWTHKGHPLWKGLATNDPALPAYVAELLVAKVRKGSPLEIAAMERKLVESDGATCVVADAEARIEAALAVLR